MTKINVTTFIKIYFIYTKLLHVIIEYIIMHKYNKTVETLRKIIEKINISTEIRFDEPLSSHTSFKTGGKCDALFTPASFDDFIKLRNEIGDNYTLIGSGTNILVSDKGIRGIVIKTSSMSEIKIEEGILVAGCGAEVKDVCKFAYDHCYSGFEFIYGMPGTIGGAVWMNARCYGSSISDIFEWAVTVDSNGKKETCYFNESDFDYKKSVFQKNNIFIIRAAFRLKKGEKTNIKKKMDDNMRDREKKGHFLYPCAGSVFKNNRDFGDPSGKIIESCGLKGKTIGNAQIAPFHANIIINKGNAKSSDILELINIIEKTVFLKKGFRLEREVLLVGDWD